MAKQFLANRSGQTPTLDEVPNETIKIYPTEADLDADLANLEENEIVATEEDNNPASGTQYPVDVVQNGNMNAVTSNAVADFIKFQNVYDDDITIPLATDGYITISVTIPVGYTAQGFFVAWSHPAVFMLAITDDAEYSGTVPLYVTYHRYTTSTTTTEHIIVRALLVKNS